MRTLSREPRPERNTGIGLLLAMTVVGSMAGCAPEGELGGSIGESVKLRFENMRAYKIGPELVLLYERASSTRSQILGDPLMNQVARLTFNTERHALEEKTDIDLDLKNDRAPALRVEHYVVEEDSAGELRQEAPFPDVVTATIRFEKIPTELGDLIEAKFDCSFDDSRVLGGDFVAKLSQP